MLQFVGPTIVMNSHTFCLEITLPPNNGPIIELSVCTNTATNTCTFLLHFQQKKYTHGFRNDLERIDQAGQGDILSNMLD